MAIERREAVLLTLLDRQVEVKQDMIEEARTEVAAARARILAAKEEGTRCTSYIQISCAFILYSWTTFETQPCNSPTISSAHGCKL